jgi:hypothetical protein
MYMQQVRAIPKSQQANYVLDDFIHKEIPQIAKKLTTKDYHS